MRPGSGDIEHLRIRNPSVPLIKRNRRHAGVAPEQAHLRVADDDRLRTVQQTAAKSFALVPPIRAHAAQLPRRRFLVGVQHETRARNQRRIFFRRTRIKKPDVPGGRIRVTRELRRLRRQSGAEQPMPKADDLFNGNAADRDLFCCVLSQNFFHNFKWVIGFIIHGPSIYFNVVVI